jgi:hypothetical protein
MDRYDSMSEGELNAETQARFAGKISVHGEFVLDFCRTPLAVGLLANDAFDRGHEMRADCRAIVLAWLRFDDARREPVGANEVVRGDV